MTARTPLGLLDIAARGLGGGVVAANDESFAAKENLLLPGDPVFDPHRYSLVGKVMDGWETRRRREPGHDWAVVRLGAPGVIRRVRVDTRHFTGNYPERCSLEACAGDGYPSPAELLGDAEWVTLLQPAPLRGGALNDFDVAAERRWTHVRLSIYPDGGVARLRVYGNVVPDPRWLGGELDLAAQENGGIVVGCSDEYFSSPHHLNAPGRPGDMADGWETRRRRGEGNDWVLLRLAGAGKITRVEVDTTCFVHNAPAAIALFATDEAGGDGTPLLPRTRLQPDTLHRFPVADSPPATHVRAEVYPDGGLARLRLWGTLTPEARAKLERRWLELGS